MPVLEKAAACASECPITTPDTSGVGQGRALQNRPDLWKKRLDKGPHPMYNCPQTSQRIGDSKTWRLLRVSS